MLVESPQVDATAASAVLRVHEIYASIQGESTLAGWPCSFVRLTGCPLRCRWCDTSHAFEGGDNLTIAEVVDRVGQLQQHHVEVTGGEPLAQAGAILLLRALVDAGHRCLLETSGALSIQSVPKEVHIVMDLKCPDSKMSHRMDWTNIEFLKPTDDIKFVVASFDDFSWALMQTKRLDLDKRFNVLVSPAFGLVNPADLAIWLRDHAEGRALRLQLQLHKYIWSPRQRGV